MKGSTLKLALTKLRAAAYTSGGVDYGKLFRHYDRDNSGLIDFREFCSLLRRDAKLSKKDVSDAEVSRQLSACVCGSM